MSDLKLDIDSKGGFVRISLQPPKGAKRHPIDLVCVVDISGSMDEEAKMKTNKSNSTERFGLTQLDVTKHACKTIIHNLEDDDRLSIVVFSDTARPIFGLKKMDKKGRKSALSDLEKLKTEGCTNIWDGLLKGLEEIKKSSDPSRNSAILLLTDAPNGEVKSFLNYRDKHKLNTTVNTFGFGYNLDSKLLNELAIEGNGFYSFIPDSSFVGTVFVHALSNLLTVFAKSVVLNIEPQGDTKFGKGGVLGSHKTQITSWGASVQLGNVYYGQNRDIIIELDIKDEKYVAATVDYQVIGDKKAKKVTLEGDGKDGKDVEIHRLRSVLLERVVKGVQSFIKEQKNTQKAIKDWVEEVKKSSVAKEKFMVELLKDGGGQITEAFSKSAFFNKWGKHYLPSLARAHLIQFCNNFKDPGVQGYGGKLFNDVRDKCDETFVKLPPPKPSKKFGGNTRTVTNMSQFHNSYAPCFHGKCAVKMADGSSKKCEEIQKDDFILGADGKSHQVLCVLKTHCYENKTKLVTLGDGLLVTPWHPVRIEGEWKFPNDLGKSVLTCCPAVYSYVLKSGHIMVIEGIECVSLAHGFKDKVVKHPYFGTENVKEDLRQMRGFDEGLIELYSNRIRVEKDKNGMVCKMVTVF